MIINWHHWMGLTASLLVGKVRGRGPSGHDNINLNLAWSLERGIPTTSPRCGWAMPKNPGVLSSTGVSINWWPWRKNCRKMAKMSGISCLTWGYGHNWKSPPGTQGKMVSLDQEEGFRKVLKELLLEESFGVTFWGCTDTPSTSYKCMIPERSHITHVCSTHFLNDRSKT